MPDQETGEIIKAFVVLKHGIRVSEKEIISYCNNYLAKYKMPQFFEFITEMSQSNLGKVLRKELRKTSLIKERE